MTARKIAISTIIISLLTVVSEFSHGPLLALSLGQQPRTRAQQSPAIRLVEMDQTDPVDLDRPYPDSIGKMKVGETGWTVPTALCIDGKRHCWISSLHPVTHKGPIGSFCLPVTLTRKGFSVDVTDVISPYQIEVWRVPPFKDSVEVATVCYKSKPYTALPEITGDPFAGRIIGDLDVGDYGWTDPRAMGATKDGKGWIDRDFRVEDFPTGSTQMLVVNTKDGICVNITRINPKVSRDWHKALSRPGQRSVKYVYYRANGKVHRSEKLPTIFR